MYHEQPKKHLRCLSGHVTSDPLVCSVTQIASGNLAQDLGCNSYIHPTHKGQASLREVGFSGHVLIKMSLHLFTSVAMFPWI
jgi:hypothetical protein